MKHPVTLSVHALAFTLSLFLVLQPGCQDRALDTPSSVVAPPGSSGAVDDAATDEDAGPEFDDGTPTRVACTQSFGSALSPAHGRLDGVLLTIVGDGQRNCHADAEHLHLQVSMQGAIYDVAVNLDGFEGEVDAKMPGIPYDEGWHPMGMDYVTDLGLHTESLTITSAASIRQRVEAALAKANHISVFGTGYPGSDGAHLVHYNGSGKDGAIVINPGAPVSHILAFRFADDTF